MRELLLIDRFDEAATELGQMGNARPILATLAWVEWRRGHLRPAITQMKRAYPEWVSAAGDHLPDGVWRILFPLRYEEELVLAARQEGLDPALVAGLIMQESTFDAGARSVAGARGLMQIMPATGRGIARRKGVRFRTASLSDPRTSLDFGTFYLRQIGERFGGAVEKALAGYNAGPNRASEWAQRRPGMTEEEFIETIPFTETRFYVRLVLANRAQYRRIYGLGVEPGTGHGRYAGVSFRMGDFKTKIDPKVLERDADVRLDGRQADQLRPVTISTGYLKHAEGSCLIELGDTRVVCAVSFEDRVPLFLRGKGEGWVTAEYGMLPRATTTRSQREASRGGPSGRTQEIQRLIGRALRAVVDMKAVGERTVWVDCDVIQADGGTRCASITGAFVALVQGLDVLRRKGTLKTVPVSDYVAAVSVGRVGDGLLLDLKYEEDSAAHVDMNVVKTGDGRFIEVQGTAEGEPFTDEEMAGLLAAAEKGIQQLVALQKEALGGFDPKKP